jgi:anaerobic dimethyl sulfoxide reductase subunit A
MAHVEDGRLVKITNNPLKNRYMFGCARGYQMPRVVYASDRLKRPLLRNGERGSGSFCEISWDEALDLLATKLEEIRSRYGDSAVMPLGGSGACLGIVHHTYNLRNRFFNLFGGHTLAEGYYSEQAVEFTSSYLFGSAFTGMDPGNLQYSKLIVLWGANIVDNRFGCEMESRIREARKRGVPVVVIDPRRSLTASRLGTEWIPINPGTDSVLMAALLFVLFEENLVKRDAVTALSAGFDKLERSIRGSEDGEAKTPEWASRICGIPASTIRDLAHRYGTVHPAALIPGLSLQRTVGGEEPVRMAAALQLATGNFGIPGGSTGANLLNKLPGPRCGNLKPNRQHSGPSVPVYRWADAVLDGKGENCPSDIHLLYMIGGNLLSQGSDVRKNIKAFQKVEFSVCHDYFLTPTARYCDVVLPVTTFLEREDVLFPRSNHLFFSHRVIVPLHQARNDYDILVDLADRLGFREEFSENRSSEEWLDHFLSQSEVDDIEEFKRTGIYRGEKQSRIGLADFARDPEGNPLDTPSGRVQIDFSDWGETGFSPLPACRFLEKSETFPLRLITPHARYRTHSQYHNIPWFRKRQDQTLWIHPKDAASRGIVDGQRVLVTSEQGSMSINARVTENILPGVVSACQGVWPEFSSDGTETAGSVNVLTSSEPTRPSMGSRTHSTLVQVEASH